MPSIFLRGGVWQIQYRLNGRHVRRSLRTRSAGDAREHLERLEAELTLGVHRLPSPLTTEDLVTRYLVRQKRRISAKEHQNYRYRLGHFLAFVGPKRRLADVRPGHVSAFLDGQAKRANNFNHWRGSLHAMFQYALDELEAVSRNPVKKVKRRKVRRPLPEWLTEEERDAILAAASPSLLVPLALGFFAGLRRGEIVGLLWRDVDYERRRVLVRDAKDFEDRTVPLAPRLAEILKNARRTAVLRVCLRGRKAWDRDNLSTYIARQGQRMGLKRLNGPQVLRRSFGAHCLIRGVPIKTVGQWLGHSSVLVTERHYVGLIPDEEGLMDRVFPEKGEDR
jgi:integrase